MDEVIVIEENIKPNRKKQTKDTGGVLGGLFGGGGKKPSGKGRSVHLLLNVHDSLLSNTGPKKAESYDTCRVM
jgi:hypothetical protein